MTWFWGNVNEVKHLCSHVHSHVLSIMCCITSRHRSKCCFSRAKAAPSSSCTRSPSLSNHKQKTNEHHKLMYHAKNISLNELKHLYNMIIWRSALLIFKLYFSPKTTCTAGGWKNPKIHPSWEPRRPFSLHGCVNAWDVIHCCSQLKAAYYSLLQLYLEGKSRFDLKNYLLKRSLKL